MHCRMFSSIFGLYSLDAGSNLQLRPPKMCPDIATYPVRDKNLPNFKTTVITREIGIMYCGVLRTKSW